MHKSFLQNAAGRDFTILDATTLRLVDSKPRLDFAA